MHQRLDQFILNNKHYDGVIGFSQGAIVASLLCALKENPEISDKAPEFRSLRFALLFSGAPSRATIHKPLYTRPLCTPSLHVWGSRDEMVPPHLSEQLLKCFMEEKRHAHTHDGGHYVPSDRQSRLVVSKFVLDVFDSTFRPRSHDVTNDNDPGNIEVRNNNDNDKDGNDIHWLRAAL